MGLFSQSEVSQSEATPLQAAIADTGLSSDVFYARLLQIADQVSELLLDFYAQPQNLATTRKADESPVTAADHAAHALLQQQLGNLTPQVPILSEESAAADISERLSWPAAWVVDPLDGTKEFIARTDQFTCNIALVIDRRPVLGLISVPVAGQHYLGVPGAGAMRFESGAGIRGEPLQTRRLDPEQPLMLLASVRHRAERVEAMMRQLEPLAIEVQRSDAGSAVKFCELLEAQADVYPRSSPCCEWDVAAGDALVCAAGGRVTDLQGQPLEYNCRETLLAERFVAAADPAVDYLSLLGPVPGLSPMQPRS